MFSPTVKLEISSKHETFRRLAAPLGACSFPDPGPQPDRGVLALRCARRTVSPGALGGAARRRGPALPEELAGSPRAH